jgi:hypothetical protein
MGLIIQEHHIVYQFVGQQNSPQFFANRAYRRSISKSGHRFEFFMQFRRQIAGIVVGIIVIHHHLDIVTHRLLKDPRQALIDKLF